MVTRSTLLVVALAGCCRAVTCPARPAATPTPSIVVGEVEPCLRRPPPARLRGDPPRDDGCPDWAVCLTLAGYQAVEAWEREARLWIVEAWSVCPHVDEDPASQPAGGAP